MENKYKPIPFWSWNDELDEKELIKQIDWMHENGIGGFFMHARGGLTTPYLGEKWFNCIKACLKRAKELDMEAYAYDENGWPSGFVGGKLLEDEYNRDMYFTYKYGKYDEKAVISYDYSGPSLIKVTSGEDVLNIYQGTSTSTADILNKDVVRKFIDLTHEQYKKHDIYNNLRGFFTDEPQYYRWDVPFTRVLPQYFLEKYNEDVIERIGLLFVDKKGYEDFRYKYYLSLQELMIESFAKQIYNWCDDNGYKLTGHYIEEVGLGKQILCCAGVMPFYEYEHIPGIDHLGRGIDDNISARQLGSVMAQLDKRQGLGEIFACAGWDATPMELKRIAEYYMVNGVNLLCHHLLPYSEHGQRKRDYPEHYSKINPWVEYSFKEFNDHFSNIGKLLANSKELANVGVFHPIRSGYFNYKRELEWGCDFGLVDLTNNLLNISNTLTKNGVMYHYLDETIMERHAYVKGDTLVVGECSYKFIIIPEGTLTFSKNTKRLFEEYASNGGKFYIVKDKPMYLEGARYNHDYLVSNVTLEDIIASKPYISPFNENIKIAFREHDNGEKFLYVFNLSDTTNVHIEVPGYCSFECGDEVLDTDLVFEKYESKILYPSNRKATPKVQNKLIELDHKFEVVKPALNYLTLDYLRYSKDGINYSHKINCMGVLDILLKERYEGDLYLKYEFELKEEVDSIESLIEDSHIKEVYINGNIVKKSGELLEKDLWLYDLSSHLKLGLNEIVIKINYYQSENVYYALFGENVQESIKNCLVYDTTIEAIYLRGYFGVYGDFSDGVASDVVIGENFYIASPKKEITSLIKDGYPFFRGTISLKQTLNVDDVNKTLFIKERFQIIDLFINGNYVKRMMFDNKVDVSKYLKVGENEIRIDLVVSNRNLLGPFHDRAEEADFVGPYTFERFGSWNEKGDSPLCLPRYTFIKTII